MYLGKTPHIVFTFSECTYTSIDPAPSFNHYMSVTELRTMYLNESLPLFERYRAMFSLRNRGDAASVEVSCLEVFLPRKLELDEVLCRVAGLGCRVPRFERIVSA